MDFYIRSIMLFAITSARTSADVHPMRRHGARVPAGCWLNKANASTICSLKLWGLHQSSSLSCSRQHVFFCSRPREMVHHFLPPPGVLFPWGFSGFRIHYFGGLCAPPEFHVLTAETPQLNYGQKFFSPLSRDSTCDLVCCVDSFRSFKLIVFQREKFTCCW